MAFRPRIWCFCKLATEWDHPATTGFDATADARDAIDGDTAANRSNNDDSPALRTLRPIAGRPSRDTVYAGEQPPAGTHHRFRWPYGQRRGTRPRRPPRSRPAGI